ncbi:MAG: hypothetical protein JO112_06115, partial [Planctomycetes bacterium]|nr:hypothetical protein [Planctomycetota bacterium]
MPNDLIGMTTEDDLAPSQAQVPLQLWQIAWRHKSLVLAGVVVALVLGTLFYVQRPRIYQSTAQVLVIKKRPDEVTGMNTHQTTLEDYVSTQQVLIRSPLIINRAIQNLQTRDPGALRSFMGEKEDLTEVVQKALTVNRNKGPGGNNNVLDLAFRGKDRAECGVVLGGIIDTYKDFLDENYRGMSDETLKLIQDARDTLQKDLKQKQEEYRTFRQQVPLLVKRKDGGYLSEDGLISISEKRSNLLLRQAETEGQLMALETAQKEGKSRETLLAMVANFVSKPNPEDTKSYRSQNLQESLLPLLEEERNLRQTLGPNHPEVLAVHQKIEAARDLFTRPSAVYADKAASAGAESVPAELDPVTFRIQYLREELQQIKVSENILGDIFKQEQNEVRKQII